MTSPYMLKSKLSTNYSLRSSPDAVPPKQGPRRVQTGDRPNLWQSCTKWLPAGLVYKLLIALYIGQGSPKDISHERLDVEALFNTWDPL